MSSLLRRLGGNRSNADRQLETEAPLGEEVHVGDLTYVPVKAANDAQVSYQDASGAPVESHSPLGLSVGSITIIFLNLSKMVGTGIFSTPAGILDGTGSIGLALMYWFIGMLVTLAMFSVYLEFAAYFPNRSGSEAVYLEQAYPRPRYFFPLVFAMQTVILSFSSGNSVVCARYLYAAGGQTASDWGIKGLAIAVYTLAFLVVVFNTKFSYYASNTIGAIKLITLIFIAITGLVVLGGHTSVEDPRANFRNAFEGQASIYGTTSAMISIIFSYAGYENAFNVVGEVKNPVKRLKYSGLGAIFIVSILYMLANIAYFAAIPKQEIIDSDLIAAGVLFTKVFGGSSAVRGLNFLIALSSFGNLIAVLLGTSRMIRECGRQGVLPWPRFWVSTKPFGTPLGPYLVKWVLTLVLILAPPAGDAFEFVVDLQVYPSTIFYFLMIVGLLLVRRRRRLNLPEPQFKTWFPLIVLAILVQLYVIVLSWYPPTTGNADVSFWYGTYIVTSIGILILCGLYWVTWTKLLPRWGGYRLRYELVRLENGAEGHYLRKIPVEQLAEYDRTHDAHGVAIGSDRESGSGDEKRGDVSVEPKQ